MTKFYSGPQNDMAKSAAKVTRITGTSRYVQRINTQLNRTLKGFIEIGNILIEAKSNLDQSAWIRMLSYELPFSRRTAEKFIKIAKDTRITNPKYMKSLPPHWSSATPRGTPS